MSEPRRGYTLFDTHVTLLTPLHIGTGRDLLLDYDYAVRSSRTWRINETALLDVQDVDDPAIADQLSRTPPAQLLRAGDFREDSPLFHYVLPGMPRSRQAGAQLREQIKDTWQQPYLPGSSLKGALRTALAWHGFGVLHMRPNVAELGRSPKWAGQRTERQILGRDPNHDLLRALHVSDSEPVGTDRLMLVNAQVLTRGGTRAPIELEAIRPETVFHLTCKLDEALFSDWARKLRLGGQGEWLQHLPAIVRAHTAERVKTELEWFAGMRAAQTVQEFYAQLANLSLPRNAFVLQLGWGGGWDSKTLGSRLRADEGFMERILADYRMARGKRQRGDPFPKSRRTVVRVSRSQDGRAVERPSMPLGWVMVELVRREHGRSTSVTEPIEIQPAPSAPRPAAPQERVTEPIPPRQPEEPPAEPAARPAPVSGPPLPSIEPGPHAGTVIRYNMKLGRGLILLDESNAEIEVHRDQLRAEVRYLSAGSRVSFSIIRADGGIQLRDVGPE